jgi:hypothetical protein
MKKLLILLLAIVAQTAVAQVGYNDYYTPVVVPVSVYQPVVVDYGYSAPVQVIVVQQYVPVVDPFYSYPAYQPQWNYNTLAVPMPITSYWNPVFEPCRQFNINPLTYEYR